MSLPGLVPRARAIGQLPALGLLTLAGMLPEHWTCEYRPAERCDEELAESLAAARPDLVAISALTASVEEAYRLCDRLRERGLATVLGGLHATACPEEAARHADCGRRRQRRNHLAAGARRCRAWRASRHLSRPRRLAAGDWPLPRFELLGPDVPRLTLQTQRGCPLACDFCAASRLLGPFQEKPIEHIERELAAIGRIDARPLVELADDNTFAGRRDPEEFSTALRSGRRPLFHRGRLADRRAAGCARGPGRFGLRASAGRHRVARLPLPRHGREAGRAGRR